MPWVESKTCFGCGENNQCGLQMKFRGTGEHLVTSYTARQDHEGYDGVLHGGIMATLLDEIMGSIVQERGKNCVTAEMTVKYILPVRTGDTIEAFANVVSEEGRKIRVHGVAKLLDGTIVATSDGLFITIE